MYNSTTWDGIKFTATNEGATATNTLTHEQCDILTLITQTERGYIYRGSAGDYPWGSAVILVTKIDDKLSAVAYPTEINARGTLDVERDLWQAIVDLQPAVYLPNEPIRNLRNGCYEWNLVLEGKVKPEDGQELFRVTNVDQAWKVTSSKTVVTLQWAKGVLWTDEGYESYRGLAESKLADIESILARDEEEEYDSQYHEDFVYDFEF